MIIVIVVVVVFVVVVVAVVAAVVVTGKPCPGMAVFNYAYTSQLHATNYHAYNQTVFVSITIIVNQSFFMHIWVPHMYNNDFPYLPNYVSLILCTLSSRSHDISLTVACLVLLTLTLHYISRKFLHKAL